MEKETKLKYEVMTRYLTLLIDEKGYVTTEDVQLILKVLNVNSLKNTEGDEDDK